VRWAESTDSRVKIWADAVAAIVGLLRLRQKLRKMRMSDPSRRSKFAQKV